MGSSGGMIHFSNSPQQGTEGPKPFLGYFDLGWVQYPYERHEDALGSGWRNWLCSAKWLS